MPINTNASFSLRFLITIGILTMHQEARSRALLEDVHFAERELLVAQRDETMARRIEQGDSGIIAMLETKRIDCEVILRSVAVPC